MYQFICYDEREKKYFITFGHYANANLARKDCLPHCKVVEPYEPSEIRVEDAVEYFKVNVKKGTISRHTTTNGTYVPELSTFADAKRYFIRGLEGDLDYLRVEVAETEEALNKARALTEADIVEQGAPEYSEELGDD